MARTYEDRGAAALDAKRLYQGFLEQLEAGVSADIDLFCREHREHAAELRRLHAMWLEVGSVFSASSGPRSLSQRIEQRFGAGIDPAISLEREVERLAARGAAHGRYRVVDEVGRGGMGTVMRVWDEDLRRSLAMKVLHGEPRERADTRSLGRFLEEAQVTGGLDHPGVVPVHELGLDAQGRVYFTMKLVQGRTFGDVIESVHSHSESWTLTRALGVLHKVCETVAYAHERGVIHRDLKPSNVMVGDFGAVYVMDWGLAHVLGNSNCKDSGSPDDTDASAPFATKDGDVLGTPAYMSPQQAAGKASEVGDAWDVYALGAMLYHLLTGSAPYTNSDHATPARAILALCLLGPPKPVHEIARDVPDELAAICAKAMARHPSQRYARALDLAADLQAWLEGRVVRAHATGAWIELRKWVQRNRPFAAALAAAALILVVGLIGTSTQYVRAEDKATEALDNLAEARRQTAIAQENATRAEAQTKTADEQRALAEQRADETQQVAVFHSEMLASLTPDEFGYALWLELRKEVQASHERLGRDVSQVQHALQALDDALAPANATTVAQRVIESRLLQPALEVASARFAHLPLVEATLLAAVAHSAHELGIVEVGVEAAGKATALRRAELGDHDLDTLASLCDLGVLLQERGELDQAEALLREAVAGFQRERGGDDPDTLAANSRLAWLLMGRAKSDEAEPLCRRVVETRRRTLGNADVDTLLSINDLALVLQDRGEFDEAESLAREAFVGLQRALGDDRHETLGAINNLAGLLKARGKLDEAEPLYRLAVAGSRRRLGDEHLDTLTALNNLAALLVRLDRSDEAEPLLRETLAGLRRKRGHDHRYTLAVLHDLARLLQDQGKLAESETLSRELVERMRRVLNSEHEDTLTAIHNLAQLLRDQGKLGDAEPLYREAVERRRNVLGDEAPPTLNSLRGLAKVLELQGKLEDAEPLFEEALEKSRQTLGDDDADTLWSARELAECLIQRARFADAEPLLLDAESRLRRTGRGPYRQVLESLRHLYASWNVVEPQRGYDATATQWMQTLERLQARK